MARRIGSTAISRPPPPERTRRTSDVEVVGDFGRTRAPHEDPALRVGVQLRAQRVDGIAVLRRLDPDDEHLPVRHGDVRGVPAHVLPDVAGEPWCEHCVIDWPHAADAAGFGAHDQVGPAGAVDPRGRHRPVGEPEYVFCEMPLPRLLVEIEVRLPLDPRALVVRVGSRDSLDQLDQVALMLVNPRRIEWGACHGSDAPHRPSTAPGRGTPQPHLPRHSRAGSAPSPMQLVPPVTGRHRSPGAGTASPGPPDRPRDLADGVLAVVEHLPRDPQLGRGHHGGPPTHPTARPARGQPVAGVLRDQVGDELAHRGEHVEQQPPAGAAGVDALVEHDQLDLALAELGDVDEVPHRAADPVQPRDDPLVAGA